MGILKLEVKMAGNPKLSFYDVRTKKKFTTDKYKVVKKRNPRIKAMMNFAVATSPSGTECWRVMGRA